MDVFGDDVNIIEYIIEGYCNVEDFFKLECVDVCELIIEVEYGGDVVYVVVYLYIYSLGLMLWGEDGCLICCFDFVYGEGNIVGNESGYVVLI